MYEEGFYLGFRPIAALIFGALYAWQGFEFAVMVWDIPSTCNVNMANCDFSQYFNARHYSDVLFQAAIVVVIQAAAMAFGIEMMWLNMIPGAIIIFALPLLLLALIVFSGVGLLALFFGFTWATLLPFILVAIAGGISLRIIFWIFGPI